MADQAETRRAHRLLAAARQGDAQAQFEYWDLHAYEPGSLKWLKRAAEQGHAEAQADLGWYYHSDSSPKRRDLTLKWWRKAAAQGDAETANYLAELLRDGDGVRCNHREAYRWFLDESRAVAEPMRWPCTVPSRR